MSSYIVKTTKLEIYDGIFVLEKQAGFHLRSDRVRAYR
jgi:hypothetical protein